MKRGLTLLWLVLAGCDDEAAWEWRGVPDEVFVAGPAASLEIAGREPLTEVSLPEEGSVLGGAEPERLEVYRIGGDRLERVPFTVSEGKLKAEFASGGRYLVHSPFDRWTRNKLDLFCRLKFVNRPLSALRSGILEPLCTRILCPADPFRADALLDEFPELREFPDTFGREELRALELGPLPDLPGAGSVCDRCFGRNWDDLQIPECGEPKKPPLSCWVPNGPAPNTRGQVENIANREVVGAINAVAPHPTDANVVYAGSVNGGIWRTGNATAASPTWVQQTDAAASLSIGALEFDPTDPSNQTLLAGVGRFSSFLSRGGARTGLLRTTDGATWTAIDGGGSVRDLNVSGVAPRGATLVISANAAGGAAVPGVWRSTNGGAAFVRVSGAAGSGLPAGPAFDLASDPGNASRLYTNAGGNGVYRSDDTGATWTRVSSAAMNTLLSGAGNVEIAVGAHNNPYVAVVRGGTLAGVFRSGDGGATWTALDLPRTLENGNAAYGVHPGGQGDIHLSLAADRGDPNLVYVGGDRQPCFTESAGCNLPNTPTFPNSIGARDYSGRLFRIDASQPAGSQAVPITHPNTAGGSAPHADSRDMDVAADGVLVEGDDGGIYRRTSPRANTGDWFSMNGDLQTAEFHSAAWDAIGNVVVSGAQDTGSSEQPAPGIRTWVSISTGDGGDVAVDDTGTPGLSVRYSSYQYLADLRRSVYDASNVLQGQVRPALTVLGGGAVLVPQFYTPIQLNHVDPDRLIIGAANSVYESLDQGDTLTEIGVGIAVNGTGSDPIGYGATGNAEMLYVGAGNRVFVRNAAAPAPLAAAATYPGTARILDIAIHPGDPDTAFAADAANVFLTSDGGATWSNVTGNLAALGAGGLRSLAFRGSGGDLVAVGTDVGVFAAPGPAYDTWSGLGCGLPRAPVYDLEYDAADRVFVAGTLGRGAWVLQR